MPQMIFVNLPVRDLETSKAFWTELGYSFDPDFSDENAASLIISDTIFAMLLTEPKFKEFTRKEITNAATSTEVILCLSAESREKVDELVDAALAAGGTAANDPHDYGFMYERSFQDPDHHNWEVMWMDEDAARKAMAEGR
ncbi:VOC family protein [Streptomyces sp. NPDC002187]|uniref:VOC family protein n=1 Tax=Streptomyces sp. NPDC002187 TaxID=3364637 RepID=UPI0036CE340A